jgi:LmbE family N-acetylglucosaminyl deacetylase
MDMALVISSGHTVCVPSLMLSPHSDDVAFSLGGALLDNFFSAAHVLTIFSKSSCTIDDRGGSLEEVTTIRKSEDYAFAQVVKANIQMTHLDRRAAPIRLGIPEEGVCTCPQNFQDEPELAVIASCLERHAVGVALVIAPLGLGGHIDHRVVMTATIERIANHMPVAFYEDLPYAGTMSLSSIETHVASVSHALISDLSPCVFQTGRPIAEKLRAVGVYESQVDSRTLGRISKHSEMIGDGRVAERLWCTSSAMSMIRGSTSL